jgi:2-polyprenyl-3-methyl-5-hydroxy-6-metoxy-1,4-benzoquinol methylase
MVHDGARRGEGRQGALRTEGYHGAQESRFSAMLESCIARIAVPENATRLAGACDLPVEHVRLLLETYCNEARVGLALIEPSLAPGQRVLEVGSGIGLLAGILTQGGVDIVGIEPGSAGFGFMPALEEVVRECIQAESSFVAMPIGVEALDPACHGTFDLVYSINVLEHLIEIDQAVATMASVLSKGGRMVHMCPNYAVPYEPHLQIPLIPGAPGLTRHLFPRHAKRYPGLWEGLNFISAGRLQRLAKANGLAIEFDERIMGDMVRRLLTDPILASRQGALVTMVAKVIEATGMQSLIDRFPPRFSTPMVARFAKL